MIYSHRYDYITVTTLGEQVSESLCRNIFIMYSCKVTSTPKCPRARSTKGLKAMSFYISNVLSRNLRFLFSIDIDKKGIRMIFNLRIGFKY